MARVDVKKDEDKGLYGGSWWSKALCVCPALQVVAENCIVWQATAKLEAVY